MIHIRHDTILRPGDVLSSPNNAEKWQVKNMTGFKINVVDPVTKSEKVLLKNDLIIQKWELQIGNGRGYW